jgi:hypothetical protein
MGLEGRSLVHILSLSLPCVSMHASIRLVFPLLYLLSVSLSSSPLCLCYLSPIVSVSLFHFLSPLPSLHLLMFGD